MFRTMIIAASVAAAAVAIVPVAHAGDAAASEYAASASAAAPEADRVDAQDKLMIVNRNTGRVIYDDGRNDLFCATQRYVAGYTDRGRPIMRRTIRCR